MPESESRVLVVDDEPDITALVAYHLAKAGYRVIDVLAELRRREETKDLGIIGATRNLLSSAMPPCPGVSAGGCPVHDCDSGSLP